ncbi:MAG TPA: hypothetical protein VK179_03940 [Bacteroidales bacterium]|nr:hypothetical protein [Bacteroidales bacterium]
MQKPNSPSMKTGFIIIIFFILFVPLNAQDVRSVRLEKKAMRRSVFIPGMFSEWKHTGGVNVDSIRVYKAEKTIYYFFNPSTTHIPVRNEWETNLRMRIKQALGKRFNDYTIHLLARNRELEEYIPNAYRETIQNTDKKRTAKSYPGPALVRRLDQPVFRNGLSDHHIAIWPSHGFFFDQQLDRWQWQRARLWQTVEDIFPWSFTSAYLVPMLENSGAVVMLPRERDPQVHEVIVDNDGSTGLSSISTTGSWTSNQYKGFKWADILFSNQNPFLDGTSLSSSSHTSSVTYIPDIPESGDYAVTVSYAKTEACDTGVRYTVHYDGGSETYTVNQCMGTGTWIYLGTFHFRKGQNQRIGSVTLTGSVPGAILSADAVRFGGGMGNVARKPGDEVIAKQRSSVQGVPDVIATPDTSVFNYVLSGKPRWMEGSRYYLQYAGMPDTLVYTLSNGKNDYNDDYMSRPEWVNYLIGPAQAQYSQKYSSGLDIPLDLSLAFHTDAGVSWGDTIIGTLGIYSTTRNEGFFPDGRSKMTSRDLTDLVQTQLVNDIRREINPIWTRRGMWDREYSEAWRPVVPSMLLELLSHQNLADMRMGLDPRFKFIASRAIYKGILRFLATEQGYDAVVQPLPPDHMAVELIGGKQVRISWQPVADSLEPSANAESYRVYVKINDGGFAPGVPTAQKSMVYELPEYNAVYSFRVTAVNKGGESFPSETISAGIRPGDNHPVLIVNGFDRVSAPAFFDKYDMAGIASWQDEGVPYSYDLSFTGSQYDFTRNSEWINDDNQGWGASHANMEASMIQGNTFSNPAVHGKSLLDAGYSFVSVSDEVFESPRFIKAVYPAIDVIFGEERGVKSLLSDSVADFRLFTQDFIKAVQEYTSIGGNLLISGAYVGTDMAENSDSAAIHFASDVLHFSWRTNHATTIGLVQATDAGSSLLPSSFEFNTGWDSPVYRVESPDAIEPSGKGAFRICRYASGSTSAGVAYSGNYRTVILGFPLETITDERQRMEVIGRIMQFLTSQTAIKKL